MRLFTAAERASERERERAVAECGSQAMDRQGRGNGSRWGRGRGLQQDGQAPPAASGGRGGRGFQGDGGWGGGAHRGRRVGYGGRRQTVAPAPAVGRVEGGNTWQQVNPSVGHGGRQQTVASAPAGGRGEGGTAWPQVGSAVGHGGGLPSVEPGPAGGGTDGGSGNSGERRGRGGPVVTGPAAGSVTTPDSLASNLIRMEISPSAAAMNLPLSKGKLVPIKRPDRGGSLGRLIQLRANDFPLLFNEKMVIYYYDVDVKPENLLEGRAALEISKSDLSAIMTELFRVNAEHFHVRTVAYDGQRNLLSPVLFDDGEFQVVVRGNAFRVTLKLVKPVPLRELMQPPCPREILQGLDVIMKDNSRRDRISVGRSFYSKDEHDQHDLGRGVVALPGFQQSIRCTEQGLVLSVDHSAMAFHKNVMVLEYLQDSPGLAFNEHTSLDERSRALVQRELKGLKVMVVHREERRKYTVFGLTRLKANDIQFNQDDSGSSLRLVDYYRDKYQREIRFKHLPCLELSKTKQNYVPMELCKLVEGQRLPKDRLHMYGDRMLRDMQLLKPWDRRNRICNLMASEDGPGRGNILNEFHVSVSHDMARATGRVLKSPPLRLRDRKSQQCKFLVKNADGQWNLLHNQVALGKSIDQWGIADFSQSRHRQSELQIEPFINKLVQKCNDLGILMARRPAFVRSYSKEIICDPHCLRKILNALKKETGGSLQILICPMAEKHEGYNSLKLIAETEVGILTQCCLNFHANQGKDQYLSNLALKMNAKLGGSNIELHDWFPRLRDKNSPVMFIGADVNHPSSWDTTSPSIAAVVASINWPVLTSYISKVQAQPRRKENIINIGSMCQELIDNYAHANHVKPQKIIYFRDGVSDSQFDMVLNEELKDIKSAIESEGYRPTITVVVAQKRHHTRFFLEDRNGPLATRTGNVPPGTVVDTQIVAPGLFNYFLCSHNGILGTSKPTHYYVLLDENGFTSDEMHQLTYDLCFTFARCTKPVSLIPPVYYADLLAYRGRAYYDAMLLESPSSASSSTSSSSFSASSNIISLPEIHVDVKNTMYFL